MTEIKTYFFIAGVAHEGKNKEWVRAEDVYTLIDEIAKEVDRQLKILDTAIDPLLNAAQEATKRIEQQQAFIDSQRRVNKELGAEIQKLNVETIPLQNTLNNLSTCSYVDWKQFQRENGE